MGQSKLWLWIVDQQLATGQKLLLLENSEILIFTISVKLEDKQISQKNACIDLAQDLKLALMKI